MATETVTQTPTLTLQGGSKALVVDGKSDITHGDWRDDLVRDGFAIIKGAIPKERAEPKKNPMSLPVGSALTSNKFSNDGIGKASCPSSLQCY